MFVFFCCAIYKLRYIVADILIIFFFRYAAMPPAQRVFEDIVCADKPVKFYADLEVDLVK